MKKAGIVGGIGPASTLDYYRGVIEGYRARTGGSYPEVVINSVSMSEMMSFVQNKDWDSLVKMLADAVNDLANAGADIAAIASNTPHIVFERVRKLSPVPLISIVEETCKYAQRKGCKRILITGTRFTMGSGLYSEALGKYGIEAVVPSEEEQADIHGFIFPNLENGIVVPEDRQRMLEIVNRLITEHEADAVALACTELPLMIKEEDLGVLILDTAQIHIASIVNSI
ncbi:MAG: amino acid racemase [Methanomassiliicoccaceae archaeon]|nr:amino acid racemase [Methanomassiliicoccaceae archaeon]